jgi:hypothetical protein
MDQTWQFRQSIARRSRSIHRAELLPLPDHGQGKQLVVATNTAIIFLNVAARCDIGATNTADWR